MNPLQSLINQISFFTDCYIQENENTRIERVGKHNVEMFTLNMLDDDLILLRDGILMTQPYRSQLEKTLRIYQKEKEVKIYLFGIKEKESITPLFVYNGILEYEEDRIILRINTDSLFVNTYAIEGICSLDQNTLKEIENELYVLAQAKEVTQGMLLELQTLLDRYNIPHSTSKNEESSETGIKNFVAYGVVKKSVNTRGIMEDLSHIGKLEDQQTLGVYSGPIKALFTSKNQGAKSKIDLDYKLLPYTLSYGQYKIFESIKRNIISVLIGPPGTGKTFTLVSLAMEAVRSGKSILVCAKTDQALDVIEKKLQQEFDNHDLILRVGRGNQAKKLKQVVKDFINKKHVRPTSSSEIGNQRKRASAQFKTIHNLEKEIERQLEDEEQYGRIVYSVKKSFLDQLKLVYLGFRISKNNKLTQNVARLRKLYKARYRVNRKLVNLEHDYRVFKNYEMLKENLSNYQWSLVARNSITYSRYSDKVNFKQLTRVLPVWLVNMADLNKSIPLKQEMFDFLFIDEASQCEVTLAIPALQRAKKAIVAGDPKQLNHISFLPKAFIDKTQKYYNLKNKPYFDYRSYSLLDMVDAVTLHTDNEGVLEEHYRSQPSIIGFNNQYFYGNGLKVMTAHGSHRSENCVHFVQLDGKQKEDNTNRKEMDFIFDQLKKRFNVEQDTHHVKSIGIISPFRNQVDLFKKYALKSLDSELIDRHDVLIGTPFEFQGEERDIVFISLALDNDSASGSFAYLSRENMFNVATSRAKTEQYIVHSFDRERISKGGLLYRFFNHQHYYNRESEEAKDIFAREVIAALKENGLEVVTQDEVISGISIDLLVHGKQNDLCIDLIGYEGAYDNVLNLEEIESLFRSNKYVYILPYRHWEQNKKTELKAIISKIEEINKNVGQTP